MRICGKAANTVNTVEVPAGHSLALLGNEGKEAKRGEKFI
jgi:hypothetical protein